MTDDGWGGRGRITAGRELGDRPLSDIDHPIRHPSSVIRHLSSVICLFVMRRAAGRR